MTRAPIRKQADSVESRDPASIPGVRLELKARAAPKYPRGPSESQTQPIHLFFQMRTPVYFWSSVIIRQGTDNRHPLTAMLAIHGSIGCIWGQAVLARITKKTSAFESLARWMVRQSVTP